MAKNQITKRRIFILIIAIITILTVYLVIRGDRPVSIETFPTPTPANTITADFLCADNKNIKAEFVNGENSFVKLILSDGRHLDLPIAISASGARYANSDESIVFWNKGDTAFIEENGVMTYEDSVTSS